MDPKANIAEQIALSHHIIGLIDGCDDSEDLERESLEAIATEAGRLAELVLALAEWNDNQRPISAGL